VRVDGHDHANRLTPVRHDVRGLILANLPQNRGRSSLELTNAHCPPAPYVVTHVTTLPHAPCVVKQTDAPCAHFRDEL
jgi:hypothetical protein